MEISLYYMATALLQNGNLFHALREMESSLHNNTAIFADYLNIPRIVTWLP